MPIQEIQKCNGPVSFRTGKILGWEEISERLQDSVWLSRNVELHLIRHAESEVNADKRITGSQDVQITTKGQIQAINLGNKLDEYYDMAFCSSLQRSQKTLDLALENGRNGRITVEKIFKDKRLDERSLGVLEGQKVQWIPAYAVGDMNYAPENGESYDEVARRILSFLLELADCVRDNDIGKLLICGHMGPMRIMVGILEEQEDPVTVLRFGFPNADILKFTWNRLKIPGFLKNIASERELP
ncbi:histidine phosphatase family protein [Argonema galeatum]|uniref:histidine phosphatase family protein n=1 Tax=Argonema galeatum TaxID=2942762 RepID=UPI00201324D7|nr:histidine phosphatase family protein [Argonema galeatum]MCL1464947.1 histidine phosphatase family protein [Argonema galeatum A003/A1]